MANQSKLQSKQYRNWVRGALGLSYLQEGLFPFTDRVVKAEHARIIQNLTPCTNCSIGNILPLHDSTDCIQKNKCNCRKKRNKKCPTCSKMYDDIVLQHRYKDPLWVSDCSLWYTDHWQFAKCFSTTSTKGSNRTAKDMDASGLLSIIINGEFFQSELHDTIDPPDDIFSQVRNIRNEILHNSTLNLTDPDITKYLQSMIAVLEDKKVLGSDPAAQAAAIKLKEILNTSIHITTNEEAKAIQTALNAINEAKEQSEESIRNVTEIATKNIDAATKQATASVSSTVSKVIDETYEPKLKELKLGQENHEARLNRHEVELKQLNKRIAELEDVKKKHQTRIEYLNQVEDLKEHLVDGYQNHSVKTSISPLMTQKNDVNIREVYVPPRMVVEDNKEDNTGKTTGTGKDRETNAKFIQGYCDLFCTEEKQNRNIFIVGDVGTGKSSFCKMMMQNWCRSIEQRRNINESGAIEGELINEKKDIHHMDRFDFLFYIPLGEIHDRTDDFVEIIKGQLKRYQALIGDIFRKESERVLVLADGLDEWASPDPNKHHGIPKSSLAGASTIIITSRQSSFGILYLKSSEYDLKVTLLGLKYVYPMIDNYMKLLDKTSEVAAFKHEFAKIPFKDMRNAPMLLQQIIWLYCKNYKIGQSRSLIYLHIINTVLAWKHDRLGIHLQIQRSNPEQLQLTKTSFDKFPRFQENQDLLLLLGEIAYDAYIKSDDSSLVFGRYKLKQLGLSDEDISAIVQIGILNEVNCTDPTQEKTRLSFIHTCYVEFFTALYICSRFSSKIAEEHSSEAVQASLESIIAVTQETSVDEIRRLENVLIMICGLVPGLTKFVCECIYKVTPKEENMDENIYDRVKYQIQALTFNCISEHNSVYQGTMVRCKLRHICPKQIHSWWSMLISNVDPKRIETCWVGSNPLSHEQYSSLSSFLPQAVSLRTLKMHYIQCYGYGCEGHTIDLTDNRELQSIELSRSSISVSGINHSCLQSCNISYCEFPHEQYCLLSASLSEAVSLRTLEIDNINCKRKRCEGHTFDLSNHRELQIVKLYECKASVSGINTTELKSCILSNCRSSHEHYTTLLSCLSQATLLETLQLFNVKCTSPECKAHCSDMSGQNLLHNIVISRSMIFFTGSFPTCLRTCIIENFDLSHEQYTSFCTFLSQAESLREIKASHIKCTEDACEGHYVDLTNHKQLRSFSLSDCNMISIIGINHTLCRRFDISNCNLSHEQCESLCISLSKAINVELIKLMAIKCTNGKCDGHFIDNPNIRELTILDCANISKRTSTS